MTRAFSPSWSLGGYWRMGKHLSNYLKPWGHGVPKSHRATPHHPRLFSGKGNHRGVRFWEVRFEPRPQSEGFHGVARFQKLEIQRNPPEALPEAPVSIWVSPFLRVPRRNGSCPFGFPL